MFAFPLHPTATAPVSFFDLMAACQSGPGAAACAAAAPARKNASAASKKAPSPPPAPAPKPAPKPAKAVDMLAQATADGWTYSLDLPGRSREGYDLEVVAATDAAGAPRLVITAPEVPADKGKRARPAIHIAFDLERDADVHSIAANAADGELVISVKKTEPVRPVKIKIAVGAGAGGDGLVEEAAVEAAPAAPVAAPAADDEDGSWVEDDDDGEGSAKGGVPASGAVLEEAT